MRQNWNQIIAPHELSYILGNPPFYGKQYQSAEQKEDMKLIFNKVKGAGVLDYVTAWYLKTSQMIQNTKIKVGFVSTNSIAQGEQTGILWNELFTKYRIKIHFAHRTFSWKNEAKGNAAVHVVIVGFANFDTKNKVIFEYEDIKGEPLSKNVKNINPYLIEGQDIVILKRRKPLCDVAKISFGNMPNDGGNFLLTPEKKDELLTTEPDAQQVIKPFLGAHEFLNGKQKYCIWLKGFPPNQLKKLKEVQRKIQNVKVHRENSSRETTQKLAQFPTLFGEIRQPKSAFVLIPRVSSERRKYIPMGFFDPDYIAGDTCLTVQDITLYEFGILQSMMHMAWVKYTCGRLKSDFRYSNEIIYNNYPCPKGVSAKHQKNVEKCAQKVLDVRAEFPESSLADLYDPLTMPPQLVKAHQALDKAVDLCYRPQAFTTESNRIEFLFDLYHQYVTPLLETEKQKQKRVRKAKKEG